MLHIIGDGNNTGKLVMGNPEKSFSVLF